MTERIEDDSAKTAKAPRPTIETEPVEQGPAPDEPSGSAADDDVRDAVGFVKGLGAALWKYAGSHHYTVLYGLAGLVLAVLILVVGLWDTIVISVFVVVGAMIGQIRDGDNGIVNFFSRLFGGRR